jgi:hypothetical protein
MARLARDHPPSGTGSRLGNQKGVEVKLLPTVPEKNIRIIVPEVRATKPILMANPTTATALRNRKGVVPNPIRTGSRGMGPVNTNPEVVTASHTVTENRGIVAGMVIPKAMGTLVLRSPMYCDSRRNWD